MSRRDQTIFYETDKMWLNFHTKITVLAHVKSKFPEPSKSHSEQNT